MKPRYESTRLLAALILGALVFAAGIALARAWLPEWQAGELPSRQAFVDRYRELARRAGVRLPATEPRVTFGGRDDDLKLDDDVIDRLGPSRAAAVGAGVLVEVKQEGAPPATGAKPRELLIRFLPSGDPLFIRWAHQAEILKGALEKEPAPSAAVQARFSRLLLRPGERFGSASHGGAGGPGTKVTVNGEPKAEDFMGTTYPVLGSDPPQYVFVIGAPGGALRLARKPTESKGDDDEGELLRSPSSFSWSCR